MRELAARPAISRNALAVKLCGRMSWHNSPDKPQPAQRHPRACVARRLVCCAAGSAPPLAQDLCALAALGTVELVTMDMVEPRAVHTLIAQRYPLGEQRQCGAQPRYLYRCAQGRFGAATLHGASFALMPRDQWIGKSENVRRGTLARSVCNVRFLVLPSVRVPHLASHLLGLMACALHEHWQQRCGARPLLLETYVDPAHDRTIAIRACVDLSAGRRDGGAQSRGRAAAPRACADPARVPWRSPTMGRDGIRRAAGLGHPRRVKRV